MRAIYQKYNRLSKGRKELEKHLSLSRKWRKKRNLNFFVIGLLDHPIKVYHLCWELIGLARKSAPKLILHPLPTKFRIFLLIPTRRKHPSVQPVLSPLIGSLKTKEKLTKNLSGINLPHLQPKYLLIKKRKPASLLNLLNSKLKRSSDSKRKNNRIMKNFTSPKVRPNLNPNQKKENSQQTL